MPEPMKPTVTIAYCVGCKWLLRAGWMAQELLQTFGEALSGVTIAPAEVPGTFRITVKTLEGEQLLWDRKREGGFPEAKEIKQRLRDVIAPDHDLGHSDR